MKKKLNFVLSLILILVIAVSAFTVPASSFENQVVISSSAVLLINLDTDTVCFSRNADHKWFASYMSELMTFIVADQEVADLAKKKVKVTRAFIDSLPYSDGSLNKFVGLKLTLRDLMGIMLMGPGSDAAYLIASTVSGGDVDGFVKKMNAKAAELKCESTLFVSPGYSESNQQYTTCFDLYKIFKPLYKIDLYREIMEKPYYVPEGYESEDEDGASEYEVQTENSFLNPASPYYFKYGTGGKYSYGPTSKSNILVTTRYKDKSYLFIALRGKNEAEKNVFADARRFVTWAYLNLSDRKVIDSEYRLAYYNVSVRWGSYDAPLFAGNSAYKTLPNNYESEKLGYEFNIPEDTHLPVFEGQIIGTADIFYEDEKIDNVNLISSTSEGVSLLGDLTHFALYPFSEILSNESEKSEGSPTVTSAEGATESGEALENNDMFM